ncbi:hydrolase [Streptomyces sp. SID5785]|uniref:glycoside hydrolase family 16 protein n=1 Tax=Streptomyces sp. SID5785 TaxID=2690309 RepID=UPI001360F7EB|nr:glycoside hydrolase family 16 protein [Streptomyces sp. SID5785]MZD05047.1 hydrolase [Streptomyces sp. SID5785]
MQIRITGRTRPVLTLAATAAVLALTVPVAVGSVPGDTGQRAADCGRLFDDFSYSGLADPALTGHGWEVRDGQGGPGPSGAYWDEDNISFPSVDGAKSLDLQLVTNGLADDTTQAEISQRGDRFLGGTYLARVRFSDTPSQGTDGDRINQTFFAISPLDHNGDPTYSELDFSEYLPNGGWGADSSVNTQTSWYTTSDDGSASDSKEARQDGSLDGWHDVMATVADGHVKYFVDGTLVADHSGKYYPRRSMTIDFNHWVIDLAYHQGAYSSVYHEAVDYVYHAKNRVETPAQAKASVNALRDAGTAYTDTVSDTDDCTT